MGNLILIKGGDLSTSKVFITHSTHDSETALKIRDYLEANGIQCWMAPRDIPVGEEWAEAILNGIQNASGMLLVFSSNSNNSSQVRREIERAIHNDIPIFPVRIENVEPSRAMEYYISSNHWMDIFGNELESSLKKLVGTVKIKLSIPDAPAISNDSKSENSYKDSNGNAETFYSEPKLKKTSRNPKSFSFPKIPKKLRISVLAFALVVIAGFQISSFLSNSEPLVEEVSEVEFSSEETLTKVISEPGMILSCTSIEQTFDGGFLLTGRRVPEDSTKIWRDIWVKKLDSEGNEEWEFTDRDTLGIAFNSYFGNRRTMCCIQLPDSSFACAYELAVTDTLEADTDTPNYMFRMGINDTLSSSSGVGFALKKLDSNGNTLLEQDFTCNNGAWEVCQVKLLTNQLGAVGIWFRTVNLHYYGTLDRFLYFSDIDSINCENSYKNLVSSQSLLHCVSLNHFRFMYLEGNSGSNYFLQEVNLPSEFPKFIIRPAEAYAFERVQIDGNPMISFTNVLSWDKESFLTFTQSLVMPNFVAHIVEFNSLGDIVKTIQIPGLHSDVREGELLATGEIVFTGSTVDSLGMRRPYFGLIDSVGGIVLKEMLPMEGKIINMDVLANDNFFFAINGVSDIVLLEVDSDGYFEFLEAEFSSNIFIEDWSDLDVNESTYWNLPWQCTIENTSERGDVLTVTGFEASFASILLNESIKINESVGIDIDVLVSNALVDTAYVQMGLFSSSDNELETDSAYATIKWNFTLGDEIIGITTSGVTGPEFPDSQFIQYGEWNRFNLSIDSSLVTYSVNGIQIGSDTLSDQALDQEAFFRIEGLSSVPFYIDSVTIRGLD